MLGNTCKWNLKEPHKNHAHSFSKSHFLHKHSNDFMNLLDKLFIDKKWIKNLNKNFTNLKAFLKIKLSFTLFKVFF